MPSRLRRARWQWVCLALLAAAPIGGASGVDVEAAIERGDAAWARRGEGQRDGAPLAGPIDEAIAAYEKALGAAPGNLEARYRLLRALYFKVDYVLADDDRALEVLDRARQLSEEGLDQLAAQLPGRRPLKKMEPEEIGEQLRGDRQAAEMFFWSAVTWGLWGREKGKFAAARQGVAGKIRDYCEVVNAVDETIENGGGHRVLGRLHYEAPHIPFITGWVDRDIAVAELERAHELAPDDLLTRVYLAEALLDHREDRREEALALLESVVNADPGDEYVVENLRSQRLARERLVEAKRRS